MIWMIDLLNIHLYKVNGRASKSHTSPHYGISTFFLIICNNLLKAKRKKLCDCEIYVQNLDVQHENRVGKNKQVNQTKQ